VASAKLALVAFTMLMISVTKVLIICTFGFWYNVAADFVQCLIFTTFYGSGDCQKYVLAPCKFYLITFSLNYYLNYWIWGFINILK